MSSLLEVTAAVYDAEVAESEIPVLLDFFTDYCGPCRKLAPVLEEVAKECEGRLKIGKVNAGNERALAVQFRISSVPCLILLDKGNEVSRKVGAAVKEELLSWIDGELEDL